MVEFVSPSPRETARQLQTYRRYLVWYFDQSGWTPGARDLLERLDRLIAKYVD
jgi:hypothetical protein